MSMVNGICIMNTSFMIFKDFLDERPSEVYADRERGPPLAKTDLFLFLAVKASVLRNFF